MPATVRRAESYRAYKTRPDATSYFACIVDPVLDAGAGADFTAMLEIFQPGGKARLHGLARAQELCFVLKGKGRAHCGGEARLIEAGDSLVMRRGGDHVIENVGPGKLYTLTVMAANRELAELIGACVEVPLDREDIGVLRRMPLKR